jgi:hypothetical protein
MATEYDQTDLYLSFFKIMDDIPMLKRFEYSFWEELTKDRQEILDIIRTGVKEPHPVTNEPVTRYALTANEINEKMESKHNKSLGKSLYYHLKILLKHDLISPAGSLVIGKRETKFYTRSAYIYIMESEGSPIQGFLEDPNLLSLITSLHPDVDQKEVATKISRLTEEFSIGEDELESFREEFNQWLEKRREFLLKLGVSGQFLRNLMVFLDVFTMLKRHHLDDLQDIYELLELPILPGGEYLP